jgi:hypothetical protein
MKTGGDIAKRKPFPEQSGKGFEYGSAHQKERAGHALFVWIVLKA